MSDHGYFVYQQEYELKQNLESEIGHLQSEQQNVKSQIIRLREDPRALEEVIHRELGYVYPDEFMLILPEENHETDNKESKE